MSDEKYVGIRISGGLVAIVSACDAIRVRGKRWYRQRYIRADGTTNTYANCTVGGNLIGMHRFVLGMRSTDKLFVDHINGNGLDNRRENLRLASHAANMQNKRPDLRERKRAESGSSQTATTAVFFDNLRGSDNAQSQISPMEVWDYAEAVKPPKPSRDKSKLSERELHVVTALYSGTTLTNYSRNAGISVKSASQYRTRALAKFGIVGADNARLAELVRQKGMVDLPSGSIP